MPRQITLLVGPPGCGKTTVAPLLAEMFDRPLLELEKLIQKEIATGSESGQYLKLCKLQNRTPDDVTLMNLFRNEILNNCPLGCFLCDYPVTLSQAQALDRFLIGSGDRQSLKVINLTATDEVCEARLRERWVHLPSGRVYNKVSFPPSSMASEEPAMLDDVSGEPLIQMEKDDKLVIPKELFKYHLGCEPQLNHFGRYEKVDCPAEKSVKDIVTECAFILVNSTFARQLTFAERNAEAMGNAPLPIVSDAPDAATRVYDRGDRLERKAPVLDAFTKNGGKFTLTKWHETVSN
ncbi:unnamed protein product [Amoebophrya sp. A120]|nr:unnamed protein product [Amoebophrya sp. A120]|eukprot:GSA120T00013944001.1